MACHQHTQQDYKNLLRDLTTVDNLWLVTNTLSKITIIFQGIFKQLVKVTSHTTENLPQIPEGFSNNWLRSPATQQRICHRFLQDLRYNFGLATTQQRTCHRSLRDLPQQWTINSNPQVNSLASNLAIRCTMTYTIKLGNWERWR